MNKKCSLSVIKYIYIYVCVCVCLNCVDIESAVLGDCQCFANYNRIKKKAPTYNNTSKH